MTAGDPAQGRPPRDLAVTLSALPIALGLALLAYMIAVEGEPGALPLLLIVGGAVGHIAARRRVSARR